MYNNPLFSEFPIVTKREGIIASKTGPTTWIKITGIEVVCGVLKTAARNLACPVFAPNNFAITHPITNPNINKKQHPIIAWNIIWYSLILKLFTINAKIKQGKIIFVTILDKPFWKLPSTIFNFFANIPKITIYNKWNVLNIEA